MLPLATDRNRLGNPPINSGAGQKNAPVMIPELDITILEGAETVRKPFHIRYRNGF